MSGRSIPEIDNILKAIREEARARGSKARAASSGEVLAPGATVVMGQPGVPAPPIAHVSDFLSLPFDVFLDEAYRAVLGREGDPAGLAHYRRALLRGSLTRLEVLGRLRLSREGRWHRPHVPGVMFAFLLATGYRLPVVGPLSALVARLLGLPAHWQDRSGLERAALATGSWMKR